MLVSTQVLFPGQGAGRGTPAAILFRGAVLGVTAALTAAGVVLVYRAIRIVNFAQASIGAGGGTLTFLFLQYTEVPFLLALMLGLALSTGIGFVVGVLSLRFAKAPRLVPTVFTIVLVQALTFLVPMIRNLPFFPRIDELSALEQLGDGAFRARVPFAGLHYGVGSLPIEFGYSEIFAVQLSVIALLGVAGFLRYTRSGVAVRALAENAERASLLGIGVGLLSCVVWALAGLLSGVGVTVSGLLTDPTVATTGGLGALLPALAAAVIGRMRSLPVTTAAAVAIGVMAEAWRWSFPDDRPLFDVALFVVVAVGLLLQPRELRRSEQEAEASSWAASQEVRATPRELLAVPSIRVARSALMIIGLAVVLAYPFAVSTGATNLGAFIAANAIIVVSMVVLTGWGGQVSLGQYAFAGMGAVLAGAFTERVGIPFWFAVPLTVLLVALVAAAVGVPALRIRGLFLLVVTFAFAVAVERVLFSSRYFGWLLPDVVERPSLLLLDFEDERSMYYLCVASLLVAVLFVSTMRRTRLGRMLLAVRDNETALRAFGLGAVQAKLFAFAVAGGLAGFAGALIAHQQRGVSQATFTAQAGVDVFVQAVFGGIGATSGALLGSGYFNLLRYFSASPVLLLVSGPLAALALLFAAPGGLVSLVMRVRDSVLRIVAQRRRLVVPSLFADMSPEALEARLWPLAGTLPDAGIAALPPFRPFAFASEVHGRTSVGREAAVGDAPSQEAAAIAGAGAVE